MPGDFGVQMDRIAAEVGVGTLSAMVEFDQAYAHRQHEDLAFRHIHGGGGKYLERALFEDLPEYMTILADRVITDSHIAMIVVAERIAKRASSNAPQRSHGLAGSDHPSVTDNGNVVYDRAASEHRRGSEEIEADNKELQDPHHYYGPWPPRLTHLGRVGRGRRNA